MVYAFGYSAVSRAPSLDQALKFEGKKNVDFKKYSEFSFLRTVPAIPVAKGNVITASQNRQKADNEKREERKAKLKKKVEIMRKGIAVGWKLAFTKSHKVQRKPLEPVEREYTLKDMYGRSNQGDMLAGNEVG